VPQADPALRPRHVLELLLPTRRVGVGHLLLADQLVEHAFAAALIIAGNLGDLLGRKRIFLAGVGLFGLASLCAGLSASGPELITARVVQGVGAAAMTPQVLATFRAMFAGQERGKAFGIYGAMLGFASAVGLVIGEC
jgi:MFS family permease